MASKLGRIYYLTSLNEAPKVGEIKKVGQSLVITYDGINYGTPTEWITKAFSGSGKLIQYPDIPKYQAETPRKPTSYQPPPRKRSFGDFA
jgi:hypothetical protein